IVASRWIRGGIGQIVIIDSLGATLSIVASGRVVLAAPSWLPDDGAILYTVGERYSNEAYLTVVGSDSRRAVTGPTTGFFEPQSRDSRVAGVTLRGMGYRVGLQDLVLDSASVSARGEDTPDPRTPVLAFDTSKATP